MTQSEIQQLIEIVRAETQKGGNTKERIATLLTELNDAKMQRDGSNLTPEDINALQTILGSGGDNIPTGTERQVLGYEPNGTPKAVTLGWKQLSDMPSAPTFSNGVLAGTAFQPDGTALFAFVKMAIDAPEAGTIPYYQTGGKLLVENGTTGKEAVNYTQVNTDYVNKTTTTTQTMNAILNAPSYILGANIGTPIAWQFGRKDGVVGYADASGVWRQLATFGSIYEHNIRGKSLSSTGVTGNYNCDLNAYTRWILTLTGNTTLNFINMILEDETITIGLTITGNFNLTFPTWLRQSPESYLYDGTKVNRIVIEITRGGSSPIGWYSITRFDS